MEPERLDIGDHVVLIGESWTVGEIKGIQLAIPGCTPNYYVKWNFCRKVSGPISGRMIEKKRPDATNAPGLGGVKAVCNLNHQER